MPATVRTYTSVCYLNIQLPQSPGSPLASDIQSPNLLGHARNPVIATDPMLQSVNIIACTHNVNPEGGTVIRNPCLFLRLSYSFFFLTFIYSSPSLTLQPCD